MRLLVLGGIGGNLLCWKVVSDPLRIWCDLWVHVGCFFVHRIVDRYVVVGLLGVVLYYCGDLELDLGLRWL